MGRTEPDYPGSGGGDRTHDQLVTSTLSFRKGMDYFFTLELRSGAGRFGERCLPTLLRDSL